MFRASASGTSVGYQEITGEHVHEDVLGDGPRQYRKSDRLNDLVTMLTTFQAMNRQNAHPGLPQSVSRSELGLVHRG